MPNPDYSLNELQPVHRRVLELHALGLRNLEIAQELGITAQTVGNVLSAPVALAYSQSLEQDLADQHQATAEALQSHTLRAVETLAEIMEAETSTTTHKLKAAVSILDRAGHGPTQKIDTRSISVRLTPELKDELRARAIAAGVLAPLTREPPDPQDPQPEGHVRVDAPPEPQEDPS